jgi:excisionase family DNA binding protein
MGAEMLLWSIKEVAFQLGGLSTRTVQRMIQRGELAFVLVGRIKRIPPGAVQDWIARNLNPAHNQPCAVSEALKEKTPCHTEETTHQSGGPVTPMQAESELDALLERVTSGKRKPSKQSGSLRRIK